MGKSIEFNGKTYWKADIGKDSKYYKSCAGGQTTYLHRAIYLYHHGSIPHGAAIHHKDFNKENNEIENLEAVSRQDHGIKHQGRSSKAIRDNLNNIRHLTKEWHGSEEGRQWHSDHGIEAYKKRKPIEKECVVCGESFDDMSRRDSSVFCSNACKSKSRRDSGIDNETRACPVCKKKFQTNKYSKIVTCSRGCANTYRAIKKRKKLKNS